MHNILWAGLHNSITILGAILSLFILLSKPKEVGIQSLILIAIAATLDLILLVILLTLRSIVYFCMFEFQSCSFTNMLKDFYDFLKENTPFFKPYTINRLLLLVTFITGN